jgi:hypothetical protein
MEPWNFKKDDKREGDILPTFIIFCEDEVSEPIYFKYFETNLIKVNIIEGQKSKIENVIKAIKECLHYGIMDYDHEKPIVKKDDTQVWCVFDRDIEENPLLIDEGNIKFNTAINTAINSGIKVAWSNDSFELWILLHFKDINPKLVINKNRDNYYNELTNIFKKLENPSEDLIRALSHKSFHYKRDLKSKNNFRNIVRNEIIKKTSEAVERAKSLEHYHSITTKPNHEKSPCTMVFLLIEELIRLGKKEL